MDSKNSLQGKCDFISWSLFELDQNFTKTLTSEEKTTIYKVNCSYNEIYMIFVVLRNDDIFEVVGVVEIAVCRNSVPHPKL